MFIGWTSKFILAFDMRWGGRAWMVCRGVYREIVDASPRANKGENIEATCPAVGAASFGRS